MIEKHFRPHLEQVLINPLLNRGISRVSPNTLTMLGALIGLGIWPLLAWHMVGLALVALVLTGLFDVLDGSVARMTNQATPFGSILDIMSDRVVEVAVMLGLLWYDPARGLWIAGMLAATLLCITSFLVVGIFTENQTHKSFHYSPGLIERFEAFIFFALMIMLPTYFAVLASIYIVLVTLTGGVRIWEARGI